jgi:hypothetical protein
VEYSSPSTYNLKTAVKGPVFKEELKKATLHRCTFKKFRGTWPRRILENLNRYKSWAAVPSVRPMKSYLGSKGNTSSIVLKCKGLKIFLDLQLRLGPTAVAVVSSEKEMTITTQLSLLYKEHCLTVPLSRIESPQL